MDLSELVYIDDTGYHFADYPTFLEWRKEQYRAIYGADVYLEADSDDGQLLAVQAKSDYDTAALGASVYNSFSPVTARGVGLSRNVKINGLERNIPSYSTAVETIIGVAGTEIVNGVVTDSLNRKWDLPASVVIPLGGEIDVVITCQVIGAITASNGTITGIFTPTLGWQTAFNTLAATPGSAVESDSEVRARQAVSTANPSLTVLDGTVGAVANLTGVTKVRAYENDTDATVDDFPEHSITLVVAGGDDTEIAQAIQVHKTPGTATNGDTTELVYDSHGMPLEISFQRALPATIDVEITVNPGVGWSADYEALIAQAIADVINAGKIGDDVLLTKLFGPAYLPGTPASLTFDIESIELGKNGGGVSASNVDLDFDEDPVCDPLTDITVIVT
jgi:uncharacterized phage protein gp47/JayE